MKSSSLGPKCMVSRKKFMNQENTSPDLDFLEPGREFLSSSLGGSNAAS